MNKVKRFLCTMDAGNAAFVIVIASLYLICAALMGFEQFIVAVFTGLGLLVCFCAIGYGVYKVIVYAQSKCKDK
jgi:hypothetical protein